MGTPFIRELAAHLRSYAEEADVELTVYDGNDDVAVQTGTAFELMYECAKNGTAEGYTTKAGITGAKENSKKYPLTDASILSQCYIVPFKPVTE